VAAPRRFHAVGTSLDDNGVKFTIRHDVPPDAVTHHVPSFLHDRLKSAPLTAAKYTLVVFAHRRVTTSRLAEKAIRRLAAERKEVVTTAALAESEAARLNRLNGDKSCEYIVRLTRLYSPGTSAGSKTR